MLHVICQLGTCAWNLSESTVIKGDELVVHRTLPWSSLLPPVQLPHIYLHKCSTQSREWHKVWIYSYLYCPVLYKDLPPSLLCMFIDVYTVVLFRYNIYTLYLYA